MYVKCMQVYYTQRIPPVYFGHSYGQLQGGTLQRIGTFRYYKRF